MLGEIKQLVFSEELKDKHRTSPSAFSRNRKLTFPFLVLFLCNFLKGSLQDEVDQLHQAICKLDVAFRWVTRSALSQARRKLSHRVFIDLLDAVCSFVDRHAGLTTYYGKRVFAIDGSTIRLPNQPNFFEAFGSSSKCGRKRAMARVSILHDVLNRITYDAQLSPYHQGENTLAFQHLEEVALPDKSILLLDRGYADFALLRSLTLSNLDFIVRVPSNLKVYREFMASNQNDLILRYRPSKNVLGRAGEVSPFRQSFQVRMVKTKIEKEIYVLMTTLLDQKAYLFDELFDLYHQRWQVEESFKVKKCRMKLEDLSGSTPELVCQDFHAKVFAETLTAALGLEIEDYLKDYNLNTRNTYALCMTQALAKMKNTLVLLFLRKRVEPLVRDLINIFKKSLVERRPGRKFPRKGSGKNRVKVQTSSYAYKSNR